MTLRMVALALAVLLSLPAVLILLRPGSTELDPEESAAHRRLEAFWAVLPIAMLAVLIVLSAAA